MNRREVAEQNFREKFERLGLSETFEFIGRNWEKDHGRQCRIRCKKCETEFDSYGVIEVFKGYQKHILCPNCGTASDGFGILSKSPVAKEILAFYKTGRSVRETAERFGITRVQVNNLVKKANATNGMDWRDGGRKSNEIRSIASARKYREYIKNGGRDYKKIRNTHLRRAIKYGCEYDEGITLDRLIKRDGLQCAICGMMCINDDSYGRYGALSPTIDHILPMSKGGGHIWSNVQIAHAICNSKKRDKVAI